MEIIISLIFLIGYLAIAAEQLLKINKTATALLTGTILWVIYISFSGDHTLATTELSRHLSSISEILFFLLGAMTIVELIDAHEGFSIVTSRIKTRDKRKLLWIISIAAFFFSAVLDNLTTAIIFVTLLRKLIEDKNERKIYACVVIIAANAGGAWSPIGDVTTTMLWIGGQITPLHIIKELFIPSFICLCASTVYFTIKMKGYFPSLSVNENREPVKGRNLIFFMGVLMFLMVPVFKSLLHIPPYIGMLIALAVVWITSEIIHSDKDEEDKVPFTAAYALSKIDSSSILFFLGILIAVSCLESTHILTSLSQKLHQNISNMDLIVFFTGIVSAVIDNVPLVAGAMGMYDISVFPADLKIWEFLAYCAGTGGSILIIGSAAGVAVMGLEKIGFYWYLKNISLIAFISYVSGALCYLILYPL